MTEVVASMMQRSYNSPVPLGMSPIAIGTSKSPHSDSFDCSDAARDAHGPSTEDSQSSPATPYLDGAVPPFSMCSLPAGGPSLGIVDDLLRVLEAVLDPQELFQSTLVNKTPSKRALAESILAGMDSHLTLPLPRLLELVPVRDVLQDLTYGQRLEVLMRAARRSRKLVLRDDLPVPPSAECTATAATTLRMGPRSHALPTSRCALIIECSQDNLAALEALQALTPQDLLAALPEYPVLLLDTSNAHVCSATGQHAVLATFPNRMSAKRAFAKLQDVKLHPGLSVRMRIEHNSIGSDASYTTFDSLASDGPYTSSGRYMHSLTPVPLSPRPSTASVALGAPTPRCPPAFGDTPPSNGLGVKATSSTAPRVLAPLSVDAGLETGLRTLRGPAACVAPIDAPLCRASAPLIAAKSEASRVGCNAQAAPFIPHSQRVARKAGMQPCWPPMSLTPGTGMAVILDGSMPDVGPIDSSEALAKLMLMDCDNGWLSGALEPFHFSMASAGREWPMTPHMCLPKVESSRPLQSASAREGTPTLAASSPSTLQPPPVLGGDAAQKPPARPQLAPPAPLGKYQLPEALGAEPQSPSTTTTTTASPDFSTTRWYQWNPYDDRNVRLSSPLVRSKESPASLRVNTPVTLNIRNHLRSPFLRSGICDTTLEDRQQRQRSEGRDRAESGALTSSSSASNSVSNNNGFAIPLNDADRMAQTKASTKSYVDAIRSTAAPRQARAAAAEDPCVHMQKKQVTAAVAAVSSNTSAAVRRKAQR